jgi:pimeloyl-ACP methyl ester carboxylesterase
MATSQYLRLGGARVFIEEDGSGIPVLCLHTAGQTGAQWRDVLAELPPRGLRVIAPDLPGHGRSDPAPLGAICDLVEYVQLCEELIAALDLTAPYVVGCSMGGKIAMELAIRGVSPLSGIVVMEADARNSALSSAALELSLEDSMSPSRADRTYFGTINSCGRAVSKERLNAIAEMHRREDPIVSVNDLIAWTSYDASDRIGRITCPAYFAVGEDDFWIGPEDVRRAAESVEGARFEILPGVGHYPMEEIPEFPDLLYRWLAELGLKRIHETRSELAAVWHATSEGGDRIDG